MKVGDNIGLVRRKIYMSRQCQFVAIMCLHCTIASQSCLLALYGITIFTTLPPFFTTHLVLIQQYHKHNHLPLAHDTNEYFLKHCCKYSSEIFELAECLIRLRDHIRVQ